MIEIKKESAEYILVDLSDRLKNVTDLSPLSPTFDVEDEEGNPVVSAQNPAVVLMQLRCLIDTTLSAFVKGGNYNLFVKFDAAPESPKLGPVEFGVT